MHKTLLFLKRKAGSAPFFAGLVVAVSLATLSLFIFIFQGAGRFSPLPPAFLEARGEAAEASDSIVLLARETNERITNANRLEDAGALSEAQELLLEAREKNRAAYEQAFLLSRHLEKMAQSLRLVRPEERQRLAYEAIAVELSLVAEFISYTRSLNSFLDSASRALASRTPEDRDLVVQSLAMVNKSTETINQLNEEFLLKMSAFDKAL